MPTVDVVDETFLTVPPKMVASAFAEQESWLRWWPDLLLRVYLDRGDAGLRWTVAGALQGTMEVWLEPVLDGTVLHYFLRADFPGGTRSSATSQARRARQDARHARSELRRRQLAAKRAALALKATLEDGRPPGVPPTV